MASTAAAATGLRQQLCRTSSNPLLHSSSLRHHRQCRRPFSILATLSFPSLSSPFPPPPLSRPPSLSADAGTRCIFSSHASATRAPRSRRSVSMEEGDVEEEEDEEGEVFDVTSHDDDELAVVEEEEEDMGEGGAGEGGPEFRGQIEYLEFESPAAHEQQQLPRYPSPKLSVKEKKELAAYAHSLGKKLKSQQVGKSGITPFVVAAFVETLEANELLKIKVHGSCPGELPEVIDQLEASTGSVAVGRIGRSVILYRPSLSKMQKKEARAVKKTWRPTPKEQAGGLKLQKKKASTKIIWSS
ncbi:hypothetical protein Taro_034709 [Colocasia esculenta]|uniref:CRM domain-containing protein n=1 Tax=Colocasia esculenta TaxID=4460 RepID=A0A843VX41_COLES|nr:hypothetical protein [Colocasia esculenta]